MNPRAILLPVSPEENQDLEAKIEDLVRETSRLIGSAHAARREELREYAVSLLRENTDTNSLGESAPREVRKAPLNALGIALLFLLLGGLLCFLVPPVGILLLAAAALIGGWGILRTLFSRR